MRRTETPRRSFRIGLTIAALVPALGVTLAPSAAQATTPAVLRVGTFHGVAGTFTTIQAAVDAAHPGDWILVGPGDYHERADYGLSTRRAGVYISTDSLHLRGMDRNGVIVDGTKVASPACSADPTKQDPGPANQGRNGILVYGPNYKGFHADNVSIDNLTVCNFLTGSGGNGNQIWWNGGDGGGKVGLSGYLGTYLTATSTYSSKTAGTFGPCCGIANPSGSYGIFSSDATHGLWQNDYASNMSDSAFYVGACQQVCDMVMDHDHGQDSALCLSSTNAGGYFVVQYTECDQNKTGLVNNSQNNDDWPSPQHGKCAIGMPGEPQQGVLHTTSCTVWQYNNLHDNNNPNVPGNGVGGLAGGGPVGTGLILAGSRSITLYRNTISNNKSWGELIVDLPDQETGPANCQGGILVPVPSAPVCFYEAAGNVSLENTFHNNGAGFGGPPNGTLGDIALGTVPHTSPPFQDQRGNCFSGDRAPGRAGNMPLTDPPAIETLPAYQPVNKMCPKSNAGDYVNLLFEAGCASQLIFPCPTPATLCDYNPQLPCIPALTPFDYARPNKNGFTLHMPAANLTPTMPNPCLGVPVNPWCPTPGNPLPDVRYAALPALLGGGILAAWFLGVRSRRRRSSS